LSLKQLDTNKLNQTSLKEIRMVEDYSIRKLVENWKQTISNSDANQNPIFQSFMQQVNFSDSMICLPQGTKLLDTQICFVKKGIEKPIGITMLINGNVVVADRGQNIVKIHDPIRGNVIKSIEPGKRWSKPSDMATLPDGRLVVRDDNGLQLFDEYGNFLKPITERGVLGRCYGLAADSKGHILTINTNPRGIPSCITKQGETDILKIDFEDNKIAEKIELVDIIDDKEQSKCRFLACDGNKVYVVDLGLNQIYVMTLGRETVRKFGKPGKAIGEFKDPAGIVVDSFGNMIIADAGNDRLQVFNRKRKPIGFVKISTRVQRPSGIYLDLETKSLYVLNLRGNSLVKVKLLC